MPSGLRDVRLVEHGVDVTQPPVQRASHVVGVDESGNPDGDEPFVMAAVQCPRSNGESLAEALIDVGLDPWRSKSSSTPAGMDWDDVSQAVEDLLVRLESIPVTWHAVAGWEYYNDKQVAAIACTVASKSLTGGGGSPPEYEGPAAFIHDGGERMYGSRQLVLRRAASRQFNGFSDRITPVYLTQIVDGDKTYPEITAADYISGYLRSVIYEDGIGGVSQDIQRIRPEWKAAGDESPETLYALKARDRRQSSRVHDRVASWIEGSRPSPGDAWGSQPIQSLTNRLTSDTVREYILTEL